MVSGQNSEDLKTFLDLKSRQYNSFDFIKDDPIQIPHLFDKKEDIEISAFLTSIISWGNRKSIIKSAKRMMELLEFSPHEFIIKSSKNEIKKLNFIHRTFNSIDFQFFIISLKNIYLKHNGLENAFSAKNKNDFLFSEISNFRKLFFSVEHEKRTEKHISSPLNGSSCKRINMFLRWMVRDDKNVDFGIWKKISKSRLSCPLDVHTGRVARKLGLIKRKQNDIKTLIELDNKLRSLDNHDPVKYDFSLFGLGMYEGF